MDYTRLIPAFIYIAVKPTDSKHNRVFDISRLNSTQEQCQRCQKQLPQGVDCNLHNVKLHIIITQSNTR